MRKTKRKLLFPVLIFSGICGVYYFTDWRINQFFIDGQPNSVAQNHRKAVAKSFCDNYNLSKTSFVLDPTVAHMLFVEHSHKFIYCEVPKVGCSNWKRIILLLNNSRGLTANDLEHYKVHSSSLLTRLKTYPASKQRQLLGNYTTVMFTRHPLERVVSAYRDKFLHDDDTYYSKGYGSKIRKVNGKMASENITFEDFVRFIVQENPQSRDVHWKPMFQLCDPCNIQYKIIGKFETIEQDADFVLKTIKAPKHLSYPSIKHHSSDSRTTAQISKHYLDTLSAGLLKDLVNVYKVDFSMFDYSHSEYTDYRNIFWKK